MQRPFIKWLAALAFLLLPGSDARQGWPDRAPGSALELPVRFVRLSLGRSSGPISIAGAWRVSGDDPRFGRLSALAAPQGKRLQALSDSGVLIDLPRPGQGRTACLRDLPDGPGTPFFKRNRDSEAMLVDPDGEGRWVTFEFRHSLWRFERDGGAVAYRLPGRREWPANKGVEAMVHEAGTGALLVLPESGRNVWRFEGAAGRRFPLAGAHGQIADAASLPDGRIVVAVRQVGLAGLTNRLAWLEREERGFRLRDFVTLPLGPLDNVEGLAAEPGPDGTIVLWAVTDNDGWRRTLLIRLELAPARQGLSHRKAEVPA